MATLQTIWSGESPGGKLPDWTSPSDFYTISDQKLEFKSADGRQRTFTVPSGYVFEIAACDAAMYNSPFNITDLKQNRRFAYCKDVDTLRAALTNGQTIASTTTVSLHLLDEAFYPTQDSLITSISNVISTAPDPGSGDSISFTYTPINTLRLTYTNNAAALVLPVGDFDPSVYLQDGLMRPIATQTVVVPGPGIIFYYFMGKVGEAPPNVTASNYTDFVADSVANKLGMLDPAAGYPQLVLDFPHNNGGGGYDNSKRHLVMVKKLAGGFGDMWGSLSDVFIVSDYVQNDGAYVPLTKVNLSLAPPYALALGTTSPEYRPFTILGGIDKIPLRLVDLKGDAVRVTNGYPSCKLLIRASPIVL
jgi:hypothetical protein